MLQLVEKLSIRWILCKSLAEFRHPQMTEGNKICFSEDMCLGKTLLSLQACESDSKTKPLCRALFWDPTKCDAAGCIFSKKCLHF